MGMIDSGKREVNPAADVESPQVKKRLHMT